MLEAKHTLFVLKSSIIRRTRAGRALSVASIVPCLLHPCHSSWQLSILTDPLSTDLPCASVRSDISPDLIVIFLLSKAAGPRAKQRSAAIACRINKRARQKDCLRGLGLEVPRHESRQNQLQALRMSNREQTPGRQKMGAKQK